MNKISILIPCFNEIKFITRTIESCIGEADEIIISDNASTDGTSDICRSFASKYPEIKYYRHENNIFGETFSFLINKAQGKYIRFLGGHDLIWPGSTQKMYSILESNNDAVQVYQNHTIYLNPDYSINRFFCLNNDTLENMLKSGDQITRVSAIPGTYDGAMFYSLYRSDILKINYKRNCFLNNMPTDQGLIVTIAKEGKIFTEKETTCILMIPRVQPTNLSETINDLNREISSVTDKIHNPFSYRFASVCEQYNIAKEVEAYQNAPKNFSRNILKKSINYLFNDLIKYKVYFNEENLYVSDNYDFIRKEVLIEIENMRMLNINSSKLISQLKFFNIIKKIIKFFIPYGLLRFFYLIKKNLKIY